MKKEYPITGRNKVKRVPSRGKYDQETVHAILDAGDIAHVSFVIDGQPFIIPTLYGRDGEAIYIHGSAASRMLKNLSGGVPCSMAVTLVDGLVLARSAFHHSMNYRSVVVYGTAVPAEGSEKENALKIISDHVIPGRWEEVRLPNRKELKGTTVLRLDIEQASAKIRTGPPSDEPEDYKAGIWAGVLPLRTIADAPEEDPDSPESLEIPPSVRDYRKLR